MRACESERVGTAFGPHGFLGSACSQRTILHPSHAGPTRLLKRKLPENKKESSRTSHV